MRILVTGSREWTDWNRVRYVLEAYKGQDVTLVHGAARGLDTIAAKVAKEFGWNVEPHPADWDTHGKKAGALRNKQMVDLGADVCIGFPLLGSIGTYHCMSIAKAAGIRTYDATETGDA